MNEYSTKELGHVIRIDDERIQDYLLKTVRGSVEETLNAMLDAKAECLCYVGRYERTEVRRDTRAGSYNRKLQTRAGEVTLKVPKLRLPLNRVQHQQEDLRQHRGLADAADRRRAAIRRQARTYEA
jgi:hypothetical protein